MRLSKAVALNYWATNALRKSKTDYPIHFIRHSILLRWHRRRNGKNNTVSLPILDMIDDTIEKSSFGVEAHSLIGETTITKDEKLLSVPTYQRLPTIYQW